MNALDFKSSSLHTNVRIVIIHTIFVAK